MRVKVNIEVLDDTGFQVEIAKNGAVFNTLHGATYFSQEAKFLSTKTDFLALDIIHLESKLFNKKMVDVSCLGYRKMWRTKDGKRSAFVTKHKFLFIVSVDIPQCWSRLDHRWFLFCLRE